MSDPRVAEPVKIGVPLFMLRPEQIGAVAQRAEGLGFESVWMAEHLVFPAQIRSRYPYSADGVAPINPATPLLDPLLVLMQVAARTERIRLGTNVYILPLRHPLAVARMAMTLDLLSQGRFTFGIGVGWLAEEFEAAGVDFATRGGRTREYVRAIRALWTEPEPSFAGRYVSFGPLKFEPKPVQKPHPPIVFGGESERRVAARRGARRRLVRRRAHAGDRRRAGRTPAGAARRCRSRRRRVRDHRQSRRRELDGRRRGALRRRRRAPGGIAGVAPGPGGGRRAAAAGGAGRPDLIRRWDLPQPRRIRDPLCVHGALWSNTACPSL